MPSENSGELVGPAVLTWHGSPGASERPQKNDKLGTFLAAQSRRTGRVAYSVSVLPQKWAVVDDHGGSQGHQRGFGRVLACT